MNDLPLCTENGDLLVIRVQGHKSKCVYKVKYLGIVTDNKLTWEDHMDHVSIKIKRNLGITKLVRNDISKELLTDLYRTIVEQHLGEMRCSSCKQITDIAK